MLWQENEDGEVRMSVVLLMMLVTLLVRIVLVP